MLGRKIAAVAVLTLIASASYSQKNPAPMKGYELFSWKENGHWHYSLLPGTNRKKTYEEITSKATVIVGTSNFESKLKLLPKGAEVSWQSDAPVGVKRPASSKATSFKQPSRKRINRIRALCEKLGMKLTLL